jgi:hypothetical protein
MTAAIDNKIHIGPLIMYAPQQERVFAHKRHLRSSVALLCTLEAEDAKNSSLQQQDALPFKPTSSEPRRFAPQLVRSLAKLSRVLSAARSAKTRPTLKRPANRPFLPASS